MANKYINIPNLGGLITNTTADKIPDRNSTDCANIDFSLDGMIQTIKGYDPYGNPVTAPGSCVRFWLYKKNFGTLKRVKMLLTDDGSTQVLKWFNEANVSVNTDGYWEVLKSGLTTGTILDKAVANGDGGSKVNKIVMGNGVDNMMVWNGATGTVASVTSNSIVLNEVLQGEGFDTAGKVIINGTDYTYTGTSSATLTGVTPNPTGILANTGVAQKVDTDILTEHIILNKSTIAFTHNQPSSNDVITDSASGFLTAGFTAGQKIAITGSAEVTNNNVYTIKSVGAGTITLADDEAIIGKTAGDLITIAAGCPKGNILLTAQRKLFLSGVTGNESKVHYSQSGEVTSFGITSGLGSGGSFDLIEGGGPITMMEAKGKNTVVIHKKDAIIAYTRDNNGTYAIENFDTLADGDDVGATNKMARAGLNKTSYFMTGLEGVKFLEEYLTNQGVSSLAMDSVTDVILPTISSYDNSNCSIAYYSKKRVLLIATNDEHGDRKVISIYIKKNDQGRFFDISIDDIPAQEFVIDNDKLYFASSLDQNVYLMFDRFSANGVKQNHKWVSKEFTFNDPATLKEFDKIYLEGFISERTKIKVTVFYGILGEKDSKTFTVSWNDNFVSTQKVSSLGTDILGTLSLGANSADISDSYIFSAPIHVDINKATRYKIRLESLYTDPDDYDAESYWAITNISTNPKGFGVDYNKMKNSNEPDGYGVGNMSVGGTNVVG